MSCLSLACTGPNLPAIPALPADTVRLVIVATTDVHAYATGWDYAFEQPHPGGLTRVATIVDSLRRRYGDMVALVDAGDLLQGNPLGDYLSREPRDPNPIVEAMNTMGYDAATPGNHDFDFGVAYLERAMRGAQFKYVSGNVVALPDGGLMFPSHAVTRHGPIKLAIGGFTTPGVNLWDQAQLAGKARVQPIEKAAPAVLAAMRKEGDVSIVLSHSGLGGGPTYDTSGVGNENAAASLARMPDAPDLVIVGHTHREMRDTLIGRTHFTQPKQWAQSVSITHVLLEQLPSGRWKILSVAPDIISLVDVPESRRLAGKLSVAHDEAVRWLNLPIGRATAAMPGQLGRVEPVPLINYIHSVQRARTGAQLSAASDFRPEAGFPAGDIRRSHVAAVYPYENTLKAVRITGGQLRAYLEQSARYYATSAAGKVGVNREIAGYNFDMVNGAEYELDLSRPVGSRVRSLKVGGRDVAPTDTFSLALNSYRASGAGGYGVLAGAPVLYDKNENIRQLLIDDIQKRQVLNPDDFAEKNWRLVPETAWRQARALFGVEDPGVQASRRPGDEPAARPGVRASERPALRILAINDLHGAILPRVHSWSNGRQVGGVAALDAAMDSAANACRCPSIRLSAGDEMQGTIESNLLHGRATVEALGRMGIAAAALGNHEFDWGLDTLRARLRDAKFLWLSANIVDSTTGQRPGWIRPWQLFALDTLKVAVVGYTFAGTKGITFPDNTANLRFQSGASALQDVLAEVKAQRPHVTILVAHDGGFCDSTCHGEIFDLARELPKGAVDAIVSGHTHSVIDTTVAGIPIIQARSSGTALGVLDLYRTGEGWRGVGEVKTAYVDQVTPDSSLGELAYQVRRQTEPLAKRRIAALAQPLLRHDDDQRESAAGNFIADAQRNVRRTDLAIMNTGGVRASLPSGDVTYEQLYAMQPFGNRVLTLRASGKDVRAALENALADGYPYAAISGITVKWDPRKPAGQRVREVTFRNKRKLRDKDTYTIAANSYIVSGGSGFSMLPGKPQVGESQGDIEVLELYLKRLPQPVPAPDTNRWQEVK